MSKPIRKYATRDLEILSRRGNSKAQSELERRALIDAARASVKSLTVVDGASYASQARFFAAIEPKHRSPGTIARDARRAAEGKYTPRVSVSQ
jgi:hypothetical protein